ncbi:MAG TPA: glycosyltransferase family 87 protein [Dehalococcoidia bacterium]|nr:glycosyltransferase family 87 protein [Dehalococcoidia bacterium]
MASQLHGASRLADAPRPAQSWLTRKLTRRRVLAYSRLFMVVSLLIWVAWLVAANAHVDRNGKLAGGDFITFYAASDLVTHGHADRAYDLQTIHQAETEAAGKDIGTFAFHYPPTFLLIVGGLSLAPYLLALAVWLAVTALALFVAARHWLNESVVFWPAVAFPGLYQNAIDGQTGFLSAALLAGGLLLLKRRPLLAGVLLGLITYKPHFAPLVFVALLVLKPRTALIGAIASSAGVALLSFVVLGDGAWRAFVNDIPFATDLLYHGGLSLAKMTSVSGALLLLHVPVLATKVLQVAVSIACAGYVVWLWRSEAPDRLRYAGLCIAITLAAPFAFDYDLPIFGLGLLFLGLECNATMWCAWEPELLTLAWILPVAFTPIAIATSVGTFPIVCAALLYLLARRVRTPVPLQPFGELSVLPLAA